MQCGREELDPYLLPGGGRERFPMTGTEDAGMLATAFASGAPLPVHQ